MRDPRIVSLRMREKVENYTSLKHDYVHDKPSPYTIPYENDEQREEYSDIAYGPRNMGRIRPNQNEWSDYIKDAQEDWLGGIASGEIELPKVKFRMSKSRKNHLSQQQFPQE